MYQLTRGQWDAISPDYKREHDGKYYFLAVDLDTHAAHEEEVCLVDVPIVEDHAIPDYYRDTWPLDPRD